MIVSSNPTEAIIEIHSFAINSVGYCKQLRLKAAKPQTKVPNELGKEINGVFCEMTMPTFGCAKDT